MTNRGNDRRSGNERRSGNDRRSGNERRERKRKEMRYIIIDGNNLIHKVAGLKKLFENDRLASGRSLLESVKSRLSRGDKLKIVFDGFGSYSDSSVIFSGKKTADEIIRQFIEENYNKNQITVVSSDMEVYRLAKACGCDAKKSEEFWKENTVIKKKVTKDKNTADSEKPSGISKKDFEEFKNLFK